MGAVCQVGLRSKKKKKPLNYTDMLLETLGLFVWRVLSACQTAMKWTPN